MYSHSALKNIFIAYLNEHKFEISPRELYEPVDYILSLGGKRMRPVFLLMGTNLFNDHIENALPAAFAVEVFHNFTLLHDDIMDEAPLRRGKTTVHTKYDINTGILSGDVMLIYAYKYLSNINDKSLLPILFDIFNKTAIGVCEGQQYDMNFENRDDVQIEEYLKMIELKTAILVAGGLEIGALIGGASSEDARHLANFGKNIGIAFQLQDDILDTFGDPEKFGKKVGGDIAQNKKTYLILKAYEVADKETKQRLKNILEDKNIDETLKIADVTQILKLLNIQELAKNLKQEYLNKAFEHLDAIKESEERKTPLRQLAAALMGREV